MTCHQLRVNMCWRLYLYPWFVLYLNLYKPRLWISFVLCIQSRFLWYLTTFIINLGLPSNLFDLLAKFTDLLPFWTNWRFRQCFKFKIDSSYNIGTCLLYYPYYIMTYGQGLGYCGSSKLLSALASFKG